MKIYNETKTEIIENPDLEKGYLKMDEIVTIIPEQPAIEEQWHYEYKNYPSGGQSRTRIVDVEGVDYVPEHEEKETIQVYIPYTEEELAKVKQQKYENLIVLKIRERYSLDQELAILRQRDTKPEEFAEYDAYVEKCKLEARQEVSNGN
jgi:hypothetical protein